jgi:CheY-like chemotaxis protein
MKADVALNGKEAILKFTSADYDLVLMDIEMPEMNGYETTAHIRNQLKSKVPIIALTAHVLEGEREKCLQLGMNDYITKPIEAGTLFEIIYKNVKPPAGAFAPPGKKVINLQYLLNTLNGKKEAMHEMINCILLQLPAYQNELNKAISDGDYQTIANYSHKMKSVVSIMGANDLVQLLVEMEALGKKETDLEKISSHNEMLNFKCRQALVEITEENKNFT